MDWTIGSPCATRVHLASGRTRQTSPVSVPTSTPPLSGSAVTAWIYAADGE
jgi:hypothetical protein